MCNKFCSCWWNRVTVAEIPLRFDLRSDCLCHEKKWSQNTNQTPTLKIHDNDINDYSTNNNDNNDNINSNTNKSSSSSSSSSKNLQGFPNNYARFITYIMILYTCCDIKHACIHWTFGESNMPWARGLAIGSTSSGINLMHLYYALSTMHCSKEFWHLIGEH